MQKFKLGFIINPVAGLGGSVALKGSDNMSEQALLLGAQPKAHLRAKTALEVLLPYQSQITVYTASSLMGEHCSNALGFDTKVIFKTQAEHTLSAEQVTLNQTTEQDTKNAILALLENDVDVILFAGGDGTARNIADVLLCRTQENQVPVLGIPAGCKIHSGVYAVTPKAAGLVVELMVTKQLVTLTTGDVMDINESLFRDGIVKAKRYGEMQIPSELRYVQAVKSGGKELDELVLQDIAADVIEKIEEEGESLFIIGSGSTTAFLMDELNLAHTLLGVDIVYQRKLIEKDVTEDLLFKAVQQQLNKNKPIKLVITIIGGQGHIFGRGNQQLSPRVIRAVISQPGGKDNIIVIATKAKLMALDSRPLIADTGDSELDQSLSGFMSITTGYKDQVLYALANPQ